MKKLTFLIVIALIANTVHSQFDFKAYYANINNAIVAHNKADYKECLEYLSKNDGNYFFEEDIAFFNGACDSLLKSGGLLDKKILNIKKHLKPQNVLPTFLKTKNKAVDFGLYDEIIKQTKGQLLVNDGYLLGIVQLDRYLSDVRVGTSEDEFPESSIKSLYRLAAINTLNIFREIKDLPNRFESNIWNDNLSLAISHNVKSLKKEEQEELLGYLWENTKKGNIYLYQYAVFYDIYFQENNTDKSLMNYYGTACSPIIISYDPLKINQKANEIYDLDNIDKRRHSIGLCSLLDWYNFKKIEYDFNLNR